MKNSTKAYIKWISLSVGALLLIIIASLLEVRFEPGTTANNIIRMVLAVGIITFFVLLYKLMNSKDFKEYLDSVDEYKENEENQITIRQMITFDIVMVIIGIVLLCVWKLLIPGFISGGLFDVAQTVKKVTVFVSIFYFVLLLAAVVYTWAVIKEKREKKKK